MLVWRAVETASEIVSGIGMWDAVPDSGTRTVRPSEHWSFRRKYIRRKHNFFQGH